MDPLAPLSRREREIMEIVFASREATLTEIQGRMTEAPTRPALRSLLTILEDKGHLKHRKEGREFVYHAVHSKEQVGKSTFGRVLSTFFNGSLTQALASYLSDPRSSLSDEEIEDLTAFVREAKMKRGATQDPKAKKPNSR